jgi:transcriptional regulator with XRE-family HTH domain
MPAKLDSEFGRWAIRDVTGADPIDLKEVSVLSKQTSVVAKPMADESFGQKLRRLRTHPSRDWTLRDLAAKAEVNFAYLSQIEAIVAKPSEELVERLAAVFGLEGRDREEFIFVARGIGEQLKEIKLKFPNLSPTYFRKAPREKK